MDIWREANFEALYFDFSLTDSDEVFTKRQGHVENAKGQISENRVIIKQLRDWFKRLSYLKGTVKWSQNPAKNNKTPNRKE